ncbi:GPI-anchored cell wall beta-1,3-endoglucanase EglC [Cordyceps fumosorosea ARSEF 2679]|uniref:Probable glucan endo-1,3-beta-glucosidase eglC n=1 Tax=Cordyceps fumosorosea (strain ARSEF 2679) TaxID=1081104 RepID=A0A162JH80_CORFA|nr:GPI-anchored cell wall beta-1,3-endoglucanase EglC [Cordyceps fumosorosea ARSEF 2679]OAA68942.1 GPI-anchored cell wall beta-1,3-endoglucanase EglC [Cordyceps fumosorosea ARSEF 2679]
MPSSSSILALATAVTGATAAFQGFNYESKGRDQAGFEAEFKNAQGLEGTNGGFTSARLYTMIQDGTVSDPISAIPAAISTKTSLLFGLWASAGQTQFDNEISALKKTAQQYCGQSLGNLVAGISVGSEDLYRDSALGQAAGENPGVGPSVLADYVQQTRDAVKGTCLEKAPIGHVDTWTAYANSTNRALSDKLDWVGMDAYPYYENQKDNGIENAKSLFQSAIDNTNTGTGGKPLWITETGWPVSGKAENKAQASIENAQTFWREVGCPRFGKVNVFWFIMQDGGPSQASAPSFGIVGGNTLSTKPLFDLSCDGYTDGGSGSSSSSSSASASASASTSASSTSPQSGASSTATGGSQSQTSATATSAQSSGAASSSAAAPSGSSSSSAGASNPGGSVPVGTGSQPSQSQPAGTGVVPSRTPTSPAGSSTPTPIASAAAAGLSSVAAAVAAIFVAVAAL